VWRNLTDRFPSPYTWQDAVAWIARTAGEGLPPRSLAIAVDGAAVGGIGLLRLDDLERLTAKVGYWLGEAHWGKGLASEALVLFTRYAFERFDLERLEGDVLDWNPASRRVLEKVGYTLEGRLRRRAIKDGAILDCWRYALLRGEPRP
jgi:RimJ/RimL family protein N-acetyltransferase